MMLMRPLCFSKLRILSGLSFVIEAYILIYSIGLFLFVLFKPFHNYI
jgi:hypothetical protein